MSAEDVAAAVDYYFAAAAAAEPFLTTKKVVRFPYKATKHITLYKHDKLENTINMKKKTINMITCQMIKHY